MKNSVCIKGKVLNSDVIELPKEWHKKINVETITVFLTPIGAHQNLIVKRCDNKKIYLQSNGGIPIHCYYQVSADLKET